MSEKNKTKLSKPKKNIKLFHIVFTIVAVFFVAGVVNAQGLVPCDGPLGDVCDMEAFGELIANIVEFAIYLGLISTAGAFAWAGVIYVTANGKQGQIEYAHSIFKKVVLGALMALSAFALIDIIITMFGVDTTISARFYDFWPSRGPGR
jgi:hypothetical protein